MNNIGVIGGADGTTQIVVSGSIGGPILWIFFGALALMVILYAAFYRRGKGKAVCLALAAVFCVAADQAVKFLVVNTMSPGESEPLLPPLLQLTRVHNYGAAWSSFSGARWLLIALTAAGMCAIAWLLVKIVRHPLGQWSLAIISAAASAISLTACASDTSLTCWTRCSWTFPSSTWRMCSSCAARSARSFTTLPFTARATRKTGGTRSMEPILLQTSEADAGTRLDACLARAIEDLTRSAAAKAVEDGRVLVNGKAPNKSYKLTGHEQIEFTPEEPAPIDTVPQDLPLDVVYEDDDVIVVNKPSGLVVHPAPGHPDGTLVNALLYHCGDSLSGVGGALRPGIVHRIDRDTSGLIIAAKNDYAHQFLSAQLADHTLARTYECIVVGNLREDSGTVDAPIARDSRDRKRMAVVPGGRRAVTHWEVIARYPGYTHVRCRLETGRTHQIRVHMAYLGHPILGDTVYGAKKAVPGLTGQCLHAVGLQFIHPRTKDLVSLTCPLPDEFTAMLRKIDR